MCVSVYVWQQGKSTGRLNPKTIIQVCLSLRTRGGFLLLCHGRSLKMKHGGCEPLHFKCVEFAFCSRVLYSTRCCIVHSNPGLNERQECWQKLEFPTVSTSYLPICLRGTLLSFDCVVLLLNTVTAIALTGTLDIHERSLKGNCIFKQG